MKLAKVLLFILFPIICFSQDAKEDLRLRTGVKLNMDLPKKFNFSVEYQYRVKNNISTFQGSYFSGNLEYAFVKNFLSGEVEYRYQTNYNRNVNVLGLGITVKEEVKKFRFSNRLLFQQKFEYTGSEFEPGHEPYTYLRDKIEAKYKCSKKLDATLFAEPFFYLSGSQNELRAIRFAAELDWEFKKRHTMNAFYYIQPGYGSASDKIIYTVGLMYKYELPKFWKKEKIRTVRTVTNSLLLTPSAVSRILYI